MAQQQSWAERVPVGDAARRGEDRRLLVELELDGAVFAAQAASGQRFGAPYPSGYAARSDYARYPTSNAGRQSRVVEREEERRRSSPKGAGSPGSSRLSSPYKLKQKVLSSRKSSLDNIGSRDRVINDDTGRHYTRDRHTSNSGLDNDRRRTRVSSGLRRDNVSSVNSSALVRDAIRQNMFLRDQILDQLQREIVPPALAVSRPRQTDGGVSPGLIRELNRLRSTSLAVVEMVEYLYSESIGIKAPNAVKQVSVDKEEDIEALEHEFLPYLLRMASSDTNFFTFSSPLMRFFDAQGVSLARNPFLDGLSLDASELLLCSCNYVSLSSPSALFSSYEVLASSSSSSSLLQLLIHKLEVFSLQTDRYLPGWQVLPCKRVAIALLHLMELETRSNASKLLPAYLRSSPAQQSTNDGSRSTGNLRQPMLPQVQSTDFTHRDDFEVTRKTDISLAALPPKMRSDAVINAWDSVLPEQNYIVPPVDVAILRETGFADNPMETGDINSHRDSPASLTQVPIACRLNRTATSIASSTAEPKSSNSSRQAKKSKGVDSARTHPIEIKLMDQQERGSPNSTGRENHVQSPKVSRTIDNAEPIKTWGTLNSPHESVLPIKYLKEPEKNATHFHASTSSRHSSHENLNPASVSSTRSEISSVRENPKPEIEIPPPLSEQNLQTRTLPLTIPRLDLDAVRMSAAVVPGNRIGFAATSPVSAAQDSNKYTSVNADISDTVNSGFELPDAGESSLRRLSTDTHSSCAVNLAGTERSHLSDPSDQFANTPDQLTIRSPGSAHLEPHTPLCVIPKDSVASCELTGWLNKETFKEQSTKTPSMVSSIAQALDLLPQFDLSNTFDEAIAVTDDDFSHQTVGRSVETSEPEGWLFGTTHDSETAEKTQPSSKSTRTLISTETGTLSSPVQNTFGSVRKTDDSLSLSALDKIFDLCRDVQVVALDMSHRFSEIEVDHRIPIERPLSNNPRAPPSQCELDETPHYLQRELKVLRRYLKEWRENARERRLVKDRLNHSIARRTIRRFGVSMVTKRQHAQGLEILEQQQVAAKALQQTWAEFAHRKSNNARASDFHLVHRCFHRLKFFAGTSKRRRQREYAKEKILRWWRRRKAQIKRVLKREEELRRIREQRAIASKSIKQALREWVLRRQLAQAKVLARQTLFKENLKWTKAKRDHERLMRTEMKRATDKANLLRASIEDLEQKWKQAEAERIQMIEHHNKIVVRQQRVIDKNRKSLAGHKIGCFVLAHLLNHKLRSVEADRSLTNQQILTLRAQYYHCDIDTQERIQKMRLEQRLLQRQLEKSSKTMKNTCNAHAHEMEAHLVTEQNLKKEMARRTIKAFIDYRRLERKSLRQQNHLEAQQRDLVDEKIETEHMAAEELREMNLTAHTKLLRLEHCLTEVDKDTRQQLATRDRLIADKEMEVQRAAKELEQSKVEANHALVTTWFSEQVKVAKIKREADAALLSAAEAIELEKQRQAQLVASQMHDMASLKIGMFITKQIDRVKVKKEEAAMQREQAERYAKELITEQKLRSFVVEMVIAVKLQSESETMLGIKQGKDGVADLFRFILIRRSRLDRLKRSMKARLAQRCWRRWNQIQQVKRVEYHMKVVRVEATKRRECATRIQRAWRLHFCWRCDRDAKLQERERKLQFIEVVRNRECARRIQHAWSRYLQWRRLCEADRERRLRRLDLIRKRECAKRIQSAWANFLAFRQRQKRELERKRLRVEAVKRRECVSRIQRAWMASVKWRKSQRELRERKIRLISHIKRRECARRIQSAWHAFVSRKRQKRVDLERKKTLIRSLKQRVCARKIQNAWRDVKQRQRELLEEHEEMERQMRVAALRKRAGARHIQGGWRRHNSRKRVHREQMDMQILRVEAIKRRECARHIQGGWRKARDRRRESEQMMTDQEQLVYLQQRSLQCGIIRDKIAARVLQRHWRAWHRIQAETRKEDRIKAIRSNQAARCIQKRLREWHHSQLQMRERHARFQRIRMSMTARVIQRGWKRHIQRLCYLKQQALDDIRKRSSARRIQSVFRQWIRQRKLSQQEQLFITTNKAAATIQRCFRHSRHMKAAVTNSHKEASSVLYHRVCSRRIVRAWRRYRHVTEFAAATHIGSVWRGRCARQAYALALEAKISQEARLEEIRLSILAVRVQHVWQDWRTRMRRRKRAEMLAREREMIEQSKRQARIKQTQQRIAAAHHIQKRFRAFSCQESKQKAEEVRDRVQRKQQEQETALVKLWEEKNARDEAAIRDGVSSVMRLWTRMDLPYVLTTAVNNVLVVDAASKIVQQLVRAYQRRSQLWFYVDNAQVSDSANNRGSRLRLFFKHASAWMEIKYQGTDSASRSENLLRLHFDAQMTRKLLVMLDRHSHSTDELQHATQEIAKDALPIFRTPECIHSHQNAIDGKLAYHDVGELELPHFCMLTRSMAKIRSIHRRKQAESPSNNSRPSTPTSAAAAAFRQRGRVQSITVFDAVENASVEDAQYLKSVGVDLAAVDPKTLRNALHMLTFSTENYRFRLEMLDFLLKNENIDVNAQDLNGDTPLMLFAAHGHLEFMARILACGGDLYRTDKNGRNALHRACEKDQVEAVAFFHRRRVDGNALELHKPNHSGQFPLHLAATKGLLECAKQMMWIAGVSSPDHLQATAWNRTVQAYRDLQGHTPLQLAVQAQDSNMVSLLLANGGDLVVNESDNCRRSVVHLAVDSLLSASGRNSPSMSTAADTLGILTLLIEHGADLNIGDERGDTALHWIALAGHVVLTRFLVTRGADIGAVNNDWETPVQVAAAHGQLGCVKAMASSPRHGSRDYGLIAGGVDSRDASTERMLSEAVNNLTHQQASPQSYYVPSAAAARPPPAKENYYWEELHQEVQLVDESGHFSSEGESDSDTDVDFGL